MRGMGESLNRVRNNGNTFESGQTLMPSKKTQITCRMEDINNIKETELVMPDPVREAVRWAPVTSNSSGVSRILDYQQENQTPRKS